MDNFIPKGFRVLFKPKQSEGIVKVEKNAAESEGEIVSHGEECWADKNSPWAKVGDKVIVKKFCGKILEDNDVLYRIIKDEDIMVVEDKSPVGWKPVGDRVLILPEKDETQVRAEQFGIALPDSYVQSQAQHSTKAKVIAIGEDCWSGGIPYANTGDDVMVGKLTGMDIKGNDGKIYRLINDLDILGVLTS